MLHSLLNLHAFEVAKHVERVTMSTTTCLLKVCMSDALFTQRRCFFVSLQFHQDLYSTNIMSKCLWICCSCFIRFNKRFLVSSLHAVACRKPTMEDVFFIPIFVGMIQARCEARDCFIPRALIHSSVTFPGSFFKGSFQCIGTAYSTTLY